MNQTFEKIYREYYERLFTLAIRITGEQYAAEDVMQEAFLNAFKAWDSFEQRSSYYTWLYSIVLNSARKYIKKERSLPVDQYAEKNNVTVNSVYEYIDSFGELPDDHVIVNQVRESCLQMFMNCLPSQYRIIYTLRIILGCTVKESADILNISENSVKIRLSRARDLLKEHIDGRCSLISKNGKCNCRSFAAHVMALGKESSMLNSELLKKSEKDASLKFQKALNELLEIDDLYDTVFTPISFEKLKERISNIKEKGDNILLS